MLQAMGQMQYSYNWRSCFLDPSSLPRKARERIAYVAAMIERSSGTVRSADKYTRWAERNAQALDAARKIAQEEQSDRPLTDAQQANDRRALMSSFAFSKKTYGGVALFPEALLRLYRQDAAAEFVETMAQNMLVDRTTYDKLNDAWAAESANACAALNNTFEKRGAQAVMRIGIYTRMRLYIAAHTLSTRSPYWQRNAEATKGILDDSATNSIEVELWQKFKSARVNFDHGYALPTDVVQMIKMAASPDKDWFDEGRNIKSSVYARLRNFVAEQGVDEEDDLSEMADELTADDLAQLVGEVTASDLAKFANL
jgi:hypothetical protein